jgi:hypothetical protein
MSMSNETAPPASARSGGATPTGIVPSPAASDPLAGEGSSDAGMDVSSLNCARQVSQPAGRLSGGGNKHQARDQAVAALLAEGKSRAETMEALGLTYWQVDEAMRRTGARVLNTTVARMRAQANKLFIERGQERRREVVKLAATLDPAAIAKRIGIARARVYEILREEGLAAGATKPAKPKPIAKPPAAAPLAPPNRKRTRAQQRQANLIKSREWRRCDTRLQALPAPSRDEANALVAQFLARRSVTVCPPAAEVQHPHNSGVGWR